MAQQRRPPPTLMLHRREFRRFQKIANAFRSAPNHVLALLAVVLFFLTRSRSSVASAGDILVKQRVSFSSPQHTHLYVLAACVIVREASDLMPEFIARNYAAGVDHFYVYGDDDDADEKTRLTAVFGHLAGLVTYMPNGRKQPSDAEEGDSYVQMRMYRHCIQKYGSETQWIAFIDTDEFFETPSLPELQTSGLFQTARRAFMHDILAHHSMFPVLCVRWKTALTNGRVVSQAPGEILQDNFPGTCRQTVDNSEKLSLRKTVLQPRFVDLAKTAKLDVAVHKGFKMQFPKRNFKCTFGIGKEIAAPVYILHYWSRSLSDYLRKVQRGRPRRSIPGRTLHDLFHRESLCQTEPDIGSSSLRIEFIRNIVSRVPLSHLRTLNESLVHVLIQPATNDTKWMFCERRVRILISQLVQGRTFSNDLYCTKMPVSVACVAEQRWPFPWAEYLSSPCPKDRHNDGSVFTTVQ